MVRLIAIAQSFQDQERLLRGRLPHRDRLEPPFQRRVLFDVLAVLVQRGRADDLQLPACQRGFENIGGVHRALRGAGADQGVQLVNKQDDVPGLDDLVDGVFDSFLKVAAVLGAGDHAGQIQRHHPFAAQQLRHVPVRDLLRQPFGDGGLADARLADEAGIILGTARQDLDDPLDLLCAPDDRVDLALFGKGGQIAPELVKRRRLAAGRASAAGRLRRRLRRRGLHRPGDILHQLIRRDAESAEQSHRHTAAVLRDRHQDMFGSHVPMPERGGVRHRHLHGLFGARREILRRQMRRRAAGLHFDDLFFIVCRRDAMLRKHGRRDAGAFPKQTQHDVLGADVGVSQRFGGMDREIQRLVGFFGKSFEHKHSLTTFPEPARRGARRARPVPCPCLPASSAWRAERRRADR